MNVLTSIMPSLPPIDEFENDLLVSYSISSDEEMSEAIVNAFHTANIDVFKKPTTINDWIDPDVFETLQWTDSPVYLSTRIWDHRVSMTAERVRIHTSVKLV